MKLHFKTSTRECFCTRTGKEVTIIKEEGTNYYTVTVRLPGLDAEYAAEGCGRREAMQVAREQYYAS